MNKVTTTALLATLNFAALADSPLSPPEERRVCNATASYCAYLDPTKDAMIYQVEGDFELKEMYQISGWHRSFHISPNGQYVVVGYPGLNLLPKSVAPDQIMLSVYLNGELQHVVKLNQLFHDLGSLQPTASHYQWGSISYLSNYEVHLKTVEGTVSVELESGEIHRASKS